MQWRNRPDVTRWLLRTTVSADDLRERLMGEPDPRDHSFVVLLGEERVAMGYLEVRDGMGQDGGREPVGAEALLGWNISPGHWRRGIGTAICAELLAIAFGELRVRRVEAGCFADNVGSWKVMEKCGMRREQHGIEDSWHAELGWVDGFTYAMLRREWEDQRAR
ncbi:GNAT N-acetyltransferase [Phycicoccus sp. MQZ13P-5]|uniref:GNAT N-acetyltransferase n=2 Tax=Phycicoccus sonneratiae TaxID=2807628 RepID=A0ABS2CIH0_9MICO|nr:GNAT N-acetyltransferase [Phycicoccus sonneraticus]